MKATAAAAGERIDALPPVPDRNVLRLESEQGDRSVYSFLERALPTATLLFAGLILLQGGDLWLLSLLILGHVVFNVVFSKLIGRLDRRYDEPLEAGKNLMNAAYVFLVTVNVGPGSFFWTLHFLPIARSMLAFQNRTVRLAMPVFLGVTAAAAEARVGASFPAAAVPVVLLLAPTLLLDVLFRFFDRRLVQEYQVRRRAENALLLSERMKAVGSLASGIAHEINTPVQYVSDSLEFVREGILDLLRICGEHRGEAGLGREAEEKAFLFQRIPVALDRMSEGLERVAEIVSSVRRISHPGSEAKRLEDLNESIRATVRVTTSAWRNVAEVELDLRDLPLVECNLGELHQVFLNLLVNSADAIREGRTGGGHGSIRIETRRHGDGVEVSITDDGCGIHPDHLHRVLEPHFTTKEVGRGTGQGLSIARAVICDHHGGTIQIESAPSRGTKVELRIPIRQGGA